MGWSLRVGQRRLGEAAGELWQALASYLGPRRQAGQGPVASRIGLAEFLDTRASFVAQMSLYGYLRTRAGMRYPELFTDKQFVVSINIAKWYLWLACLSDLAVYSGALLFIRAETDERSVQAAVKEVVEHVLARTGMPPDAGDGFSDHAKAVLNRLELIDWSSLEDGEGAFSHSPEALVQHAPIVRELMELDAHIVRNSVRFRWIEVRRDLRSQLDARAVLASPPAGEPARHKEGHGEDDAVAKV